MYKGVSSIGKMLSAIALLSYLACPAWAQGSDATSPIKIGFETSTTGVAANVGQEMINGINLYLDTVHHKMGGRNVQIIFEDDASKAATALTKYEKLVKEDKVDVVAGWVLSNLGYSIAPYTDKYHVPTIFSVCSGDGLTKRKHQHWILRTAWSSSQPSHPFGDYAFKKLHLKHIVTMGLDYPFGWETVGGFQRSYEEAGGKVVQKIWVPLGTTDFTPFLAKVRKDAEAVYASFIAGSSLTFAKQFKEQKPGMMLIANGPTLDEGSLPSLGDSAIGDIGVSLYCATLNNPANKKFVAAYRAKYKADPAFWSECGYTTGLLIDKAVEELKGDVSDKEKFLDTLKKVSLKDAPRGPLRLDDFGNPVENIYVYKVQKGKNGLENDVIETFPNITQFWKYDPEKFMDGAEYTRSVPICKYCSDK